MTDDQASPQPTAADASAQALVANAGRLGLTWDLRPATVTESAPLAVICDGDDTGIGATSMIGPVAIGDRIYVITVPPSGQFVVGWVNNRPGVIAWGRRTTNFTVSTAEAGCLRVDEVQTLPGHVYRITTSTLNWFQGTANQSIEARLRVSTAGVATTSSTQIGGAQDEASTTFVPRQGVVLIADYTPGRALVSFLLSFAIIGGTGTGTMQGSTTFPISIYIEDMGYLLNTGQVL